MKANLIKLLNKALEMEHSAYVQYLSHAQLIDGLESDPLISRLEEIANDEKEHAEKLRTLIGDYLGGVPSMKLDKTFSAKNIKEILRVNLKSEVEAVDYYSVILEEIKKAKQSIPYVFWKLEHQVRHILMDEQEHIAELKILLGEKA